MRDTLRFHNAFLWRVLHADRAYTSGQSKLNREITSIPGSGYYNTCTVCTQERAIQGIAYDGHQNWSRGWTLSRKGHEQE